MIDLRQPSFSGTPEERLKQIADYLFQLNEQLQFAFNEIDHEVVTATEKATMAVQQGGTTTVIKSDSGVPKTEADIQETFNNIKALIIKSADIVDAYYYKINEKILASNQFVAESEFGTYKTEVETKFQSTYDGAIQFSTDRIEEISTDVTNKSKDLQNQLNNTNANLNDVQTQSKKSIDEVESKVDATSSALGKVNSTYGQTDNYAKIMKESGYMKVGFLDEDQDGQRVYGIEIGYEESIDKITTEKSCARFTSNEVVFYDQNQDRGAWLSNKTLHADKVEMVSESAIGGFVDKVDKLNKRVITKWVDSEET